MPIRILYPGALDECMAKPRSAKSRSAAAANGAPQYISKKVSAFVIFFTFRLLIGKQNIPGAHRIAMLTPEHIFLQQVEANMGIIRKIVHLYVEHPDDRRDLQQEILYQAWKAFPGFQGLSNSPPGCIASA
ncbi:MAG: hypothetical protein IPM98_17995 [Lewinellaceae bacterium]|nr:hypothetical protein [Lewinellaceae bacterium]